MSICFKGFTNYYLYDTISYLKIIKTKKNIDCTVYFIYFTIILDFCSEKHFLIRRLDPIVCI